jgi:hypothetical protein
LTLFLCWLVFPAVLAALSLGCGLLLERLARTRLPFELLVPTGFAAIVGVSLFALSSRTARLALPAVLALATVGLGATLRRSRSRIDPWAVAAALGIFAAFAAPVVLSGDATFAGYVKLDDTATFLALTDRAMEHGRNLEGLAPSSYEATLAFNLPFYPLGSLLPLGFTAALVGQDAAWVFQPYLAVLAALLALSLYRLAGLTVVSRPARALAAFLAAQAALLYGYALWGGVKEVAAAALVALAAALTSETFKARGSSLALLPLGIAAAALVGVLSIGAAVWLVPAFGVIAYMLLRRRSGLRPVALVAAGAALLVPSLAVARLMFGEGVLSSVRDEAELGNLVSALSPLQIVGIWPVGDFRFRPHRMDMAYALAALTVAAAVGGLLVAAARRAWELPLYLTGAVGAAALYALVASPWIEAKAFAIASPAARRRGGIGAPTQRHPAPRRLDCAQGRLRRPRLLSARRGTGLPDARLAQDAGRQPAARGVPGRLATALLRSLAAPRLASLCLWHRPVRSAPQRQRQHIVCPDERTLRALGRWFRARRADRLRTARLRRWSSPPGTTRSRVVSGWRDSVLARPARRDRPAQAQRCAP